MDKVREEFEVWFMKEKADKIQDDIQFLTKEVMYEGWKASREAIVVQLPDSVTGGGACYMLAVINELDKVGVRYE